MNPPNPHPSLCRITLELTKAKLRPGYAYDICSTALELGQLHDRDADSLFRTLVLDEHWTPDEAAPVWCAATHYEMGPCMDPPPEGETP